VTPTLQASKYLPDCLASIAAQSQAVRIEHIAVDDGSTDGTRELLIASGATVLEGRRGGLYAAMNQGLHHASGDVVGVLNADDTLLPGALEAVVSAIAGSGRPWTIGGLTWVDSAGQEIGTIAAPPTWWNVRCHGALGWNLVHHQSTYLSREFWLSLGGFDEEMSSAADYDFMARGLQLSSFARIGMPIATFRRHGANISITDPRALLESRAVSEKFGPEGVLQRSLLAVACKSYVRMRNPKWAQREFRIRRQL